MEIIKELIQEGEKLKGTFIREEMGFILTNDEEKVSEWITKSIRIIEKEELQHSESPLYKEFARWVGNISRLYKNNFEGLVGILKGIEITPEEDMDWGELNK